MVAIAFYFVYVFISATSPAEIKKTKGKNLKQKLVTVVLAPMETITEGITLTASGIFRVLPAAILFSGSVKWALIAYVFFAIASVVRLFEVDLENIFARALCGPAIIMGTGLNKIVLGTIFALPFWVLLMSLASSS